MIAEMRDGFADHVVVGGGVVSGPEDFVLYVGEGLKKEFNTKIAEFGAPFETRTNGGRKEEGLPADVKQTGEPPAFLAAPLDRYDRVLKGPS